MRNLKKIFLLVLLLAFTLLLTSCRKADNTIEFTFYDIEKDNVSEVLLTKEFDLNKKLDNVKFYHVTRTGGFAVKNKKNAFEATANKVEFTKDGENWLSEEEIGNNFEDVIAKKYLYNFEHEPEKKKDDRYDTKAEIVQHLDGAISDYKTVYYDYLGFEDNKLVRNGAVLSTTYLFDGSNINFYVINGEDAKHISHEDIIFKEGQYPNDKEAEMDEAGKNFILAKTYDVEGTYEGLNLEFKLRLQGQYKPLAAKTASFWNWIFLQMPIAFFMALVSKIFNNSFAMGILITTIAVRTLAWPIYAKTNDMSLKMSVAQPDLDRLNKKYATRKDPESQQKMQMEMMAIYKKHNINMFGCLLPFLQMPIFFAMFEVVRRIVIPGGQWYENVANTKFLFTDLANPGIWAKLAATALVGITMFGLQKISQKKPSYAKESPVSQKTPEQQQTEQTMKMVSFFMIFMMIMTSYATPGIALSYYWIIGNLYSIGQTLLNRHLSEVKYKKLEEEKLYGRSREIIDAEFKKKGDK